MLGLKLRKVGVHFVVVIFLCLLAGFLIGWWHLLPHKVLALGGRGMTLGVFFLLLTMGLKIGVDRLILSQLGVFGLQAFFYAFSSIFGSLIVVYVLEKLLVGKPIQKAGIEQSNPGMIEPAESGLAHPYRMTLLILGALLLGILLGFTIFPPSAQDKIPVATSIALNFTLFTVGIELGLNREVWSQILHMGWQVLLAPIGVVLGSVSAGILVGALFGHTWREGAAVGAGFGWYSLSGVLISNLHSVSLGTTAFFSNIFREIFSILLAPFLAQRVSPLLLVAPGGATTMDSTLPLLVTVGPKGTGMIAFVSGFALTALVPFLVPLLLGNL